MKTLRAFVALTFISLLTVSNLDAFSLVQNDSTVVSSERNERELFDTFEKGILFGLDSEVQGVVESILYNAVSYKIAYPHFESQKVVEKIREVALEGANHSLRYKAYLTLAYYKNQDQFDTPGSLVGLLDIRDQNRIFFYLQNEIHSDQYTIATD